MTLPVPDFKEMDIIIQGSSLSFKDLSTEHHYTLLLFRNDNLIGTIEYYQFSDRTKMLIQQSENDDPLETIEWEIEHSLPLNETNPNETIQTFEELHLLR